VHREERRRITCSPELHQATLSRSISTLSFAHGPICQKARVFEVCEGGEFFDLIHDLCIFIYSLMRQIDLLHFRCLNQHVDFSMFELGTVIDDVRGPKTAV